jgi:hypothetical protein
MKILGSYPDLFNYFKEGEKYSLDSFKEAGGVAITAEVMEYFWKRCGWGGEGGGKQLVGDEKEFLTRTVSMVTKIYGNCSEVCGVPKQLRLIFPILKEIIIEFGRFANVKELKLEDELEELVNGITPSMISGLMVNLIRLSQNEENRMELLKNDIVPNILEWFFVGESYDAYIKASSIKWNSAVSIERICKCEKEDTMKLFVKEGNFLGCLSIALQNLSQIKDLKHSYVLCDALGSLVMKWTMAAEWLFKNEKGILGSIEKVLKMGQGLLQEMHEKVCFMSIYGCYLFIYFHPFKTLRHQKQVL